MTGTVNKDTISRVLRNIGKFTVDSAAGTPLKSVTGRNEVHKIVQEGLKDGKGQEDVKLMMKETEERANSVKEQDNVLAKTVEQSEVLKKIADEGIKSSDLPSNDQKKIFIRSRL